MTIPAFAPADSLIPTTSSAETASTMRIAGMLTMPCTIVPSASWLLVPNAVAHCGGSTTPTSFRKLTT